MEAKDDAGVWNYPTFKSLGGSSFLVKHRRDDALPIGSVVAVARANGDVVLVTIKGRLSLTKGSKANYFEYVFTRTYLAGLSADEFIHSCCFGGKVAIRDLEGVWYSNGGVVKKPSVPSMSAR